MRYLFCTMQFYVALTVLFTITGHSMPLYIIPCYSVLWPTWHDMTWCDVVCCIPMQSLSLSLCIYIYIQLLLSSLLLLGVYIYIYIHIHIHTHTHLRCDPQDRTECTNCPGRAAPTLPVFRSVDARCGEPLAQRSLDTLRLGHHICTLYYDMLS